jgi:SecD/SecF fusion protein
MTNRRRNLFILLLVAGLITASLVVIATQPTRLGLDLRGGVELVYRGEPTPQQPKVTPEAIDRSIEIIRQRTDKLGVAEPEISRVGADQISVGLPDVKNAQRAIDRVGTTAQLFFYDWEPNVIGDPERPISKLYDAVLRASKRKPECRRCTADNRYYLFGKESEQLRAGPEPKRADLFEQTKGRQPPNTVVLEVPKGTAVVEAERNVPQGSDAQPPPQYFVVRDRPELTGTDVKDPKQEFDPTTNQPIVTMKFTGEGRKKFQSVTRRIAQRGLENAVPGVPAVQNSQHFAIVLDDRIVSRPYINYQENPDGIDGRTGAQISGGFTITEAQDLSDFLRIGALPIKLKLISQTQVSATLGKQALDQGLRAGIAGLALGILFLLAYYRLLGVIAALGLVTYAVFFYAMIKLIPVTLTLPGIAGLILTIGVAADSNIVIFERVKEEFRAGRSIPAALAAGYSKGFKTIVDANVITLFTAFILFVLATAGVKGFAFTLGVGTVVSLFTAVVFTQAILGTFSRTSWLRRPSLLGATQERVRWHFDFMGASRWFFSMSGVILLVGAIGFSTLGLNLGLDFESGTRVKTSLQKPASENQVRDVLAPLGLEGAKIQGAQDREFGPNVFQIRAAQLSPDDVGKARDALDRAFGVSADGFSSQSIGPTFGEQVARSAVYAIIFSLLLISAYIALRFEAKFAVPVLIALVHDVIITAGVYSLSEREVTSATVAAFLTILGYSMYDTIIVFDRVRENMPRMQRASFSQIVNRSMSEVFTRSLATGFVTLIAVASLMVFGGETLKDFAFALLVGILSGAYSSIFIASPVLTAWKEREPVYRRRRAKLIQELGRVPAFADENLPAATRRDGAEALDDIEELEDDVEPAPIPAAAVDVEPAEDGPPDEDAPVETTVGASGRKPPPSPPQRKRQQRRRKHGRRR